MTDTVRARAPAPSPARSAESDDRAGPAVGFRPSPRRRNRIAAGVALGAAAIGGNVLVYSSLDDRSAVVQVVRDVPAGQQISADMLRTVDADVDGTVNVVPGDSVDAVVGRYARVRLVSGSLLTAEALQPGPLVRPGNAVVAIRVPDGALPVGLRERVAVQLVLPGDGSAAPRTIAGEVVALPTQPDAVLGVQSLSVELVTGDAAAVAAADDVRVVLLAPDLATDEDGS